MRPILTLGVIILFIASAYYDLKVGTIPYKNSEDEKEMEQQEENDQTNINNDSNNIEQEETIPYEEIVVEAGQTVYEIVRNLHNNRLTIAPHKVVDDFEALNPNVSAHEIIIGHRYLFPVYSSQ